MKQLIVCLLAGFIFGMGLALSNMIDPNKVLNFLDIMGDWDPSLAFVMIGALCVSTLAYQRIPKRTQPVLEDHFRIPSNTKIDKSLILGAVLFGIGWGMAGFCPGPALSSVGLALLDPVIFVFAMLCGFATHYFIFDRKSEDK